ncbi:alkaline phosphatase family protein [Pedobacter borealis]|uniref:alkaline phosphatase family protein n=1 Tax=Pedobacter borealis TaxID=475254 RepID=UPI000492F3BB|nr:alkaline phosphatase family protein [Pedobacter borealis]
MKISNKFKYYSALALFIPLCFTACKKYANPPAVYEELKNLNAAQRKVLVISIDGLTGTELQAVAPTNITALQKNSKYSYNTLKTASDAAGWVSMLTGTGFSKHQISNNNFDRVQAADEHAPIVSYRNVFDYVTQYKTVKTALVTPWVNLRGYMRNADFSPVVTTDLAVKDSTVSILNSQTGLGTIFVNFREVEAAGDNGGYLASNVNYKNAIIKADEYVGNILTALKARKNYANEDWLVIITSNHGGSSANPTNGFTLVYNPVFKPFELKKTGFNTILFKGKNILAYVPNDNGLYDPGTDKSFTVQMQIKVLTPSPAYVGFLSKGTGYGVGTSSVDGWTMGTWAKLWKPYYNGGFTADQATLADATWHTLTITLNTTNATTRTLTTYTDGVSSTGTVNLGTKPLTSAQPLQIGWRNVDNNAPIDFYAANLTYFNTALDATTIKNNIALKDITKHPNYANLIGFWPLDEGSEGTIFNKALTGYNMQLAGQYVWTSLASDYPPGTTSEPITSSLSIPSTVSDVSALTLYWMKINILSDFGFDGKPYLKNFEIEFLK